MGHEPTKTFARKPGVEVEGRRLDLERWLTPLVEVEVDGVVGSRANRAGDDGEQRKRRAMEVAAGDKPSTRMTPDDRLKFAGVLQVLTVHVPNAGRKRRVMQEE